MASHIRAIAILHIIFGALGLLGGLVALLFFGGLAAFTGGGGMRMPMDGTALGAIGFVVFTIAVILALPSFIGGLGLLRFRPWARTLMIVLSVFHLFNVPFGTALGIYGLWALLSTEGARLFERRDAGVNAVPGAYRTPINGGPR